MVDPTTDDRVPPYSTEAEMCVLGSVLRDNTLLPELLRIIRPDDFYHDGNRKIFQTIVDLYNDGKPIDLMFLYDALQRKDLDGDIGGAKYLSELWDAAPTAANVEHYARIVRNTSILRLNPD